MLVVIAVFLFYYVFKKGLSQSLTGHTYSTNFSYFDYFS